MHIRASPLEYQLGYSTVSYPEPTWLASVASSWLGFAPANYFVFSGPSFALFASGGGDPWPFDAPDVGFTEVSEEFYEENIPDYDVW